MEWLEDIRRHVEAHFGDRVEWVQSSAGGWSCGINVLTEQGRRMAVAVRRGDSPRDVAEALEERFHCATS